MPSVFRVHDTDPEVSTSLVDPNCDSYNLSVGLFVGDDSEVVGAVIFSTRRRRIPDQAFQPLMIDEASVPGDRASIDPWIHVYRLEFSFLRKGPHSLSL